MGAAAKALLASAATNDCGDPQWLDNGDALFICTVRSTSWPRIVVMSGAASTLYKADGLPAMYPVLEAALARASGGRPTDAGTAILKAKFPPPM